MSVVVARYEQCLRDGEIRKDPAQQAALHALDQLWVQLTRRADQRKRWWARFSRPLDRAPVPGVYLWGGVGRGKTFLMDLFFDALEWPELKILAI